MTQGLSRRPLDRGPKANMLRFLFPGLTAEPARGAKLFDAVTAAARQRHWYVEGEIADSLDGRFAVLACALALCLVRLEHDGEAGNVASVALTERFIAVMEAEHRELGLGDPALGKTVRKLVASLARRTELWRSVVAGERDWSDATRESLYPMPPKPASLRHSSKAVRSWWKLLQATPLSALAEGKIE